MSELGSEKNRFDPSYSKIAVLLHWMIAILVIGNLATGPFMEELPLSQKRIVLPLHVSSGITIFFLTVVRIGWRMMHRPPPLLPTRHWWEPKLARIVHLLLYAAMVILPLSGWAVISANPPRPPSLAGKPGPGSPPVVWGLVRFPLAATLQQIGARPEGIKRQKQIHDQLVVLHSVGGFLMMALLALHVLGVMKHEFLDGQRELARMSIRRRRPK